jgi:hypothetical protein
LQGLSSLFFWTHFPLAANASQIAVVEKTDLKSVKIICYPSSVSNISNCQLFVAMHFTVHFTVTLSEPLNDGEFVFVVGNSAALGEWNPMNAFRLSKTDDG